VTEATPAAETEAPATPAPAEVQAAEAPAEAEALTPMERVAEAIADLRLAAEACDSPMSMELLSAIASNPGAAGVIADPILAEAASELAAALADAAKATKPEAQAIREFTENNPNNPEYSGVKQSQIDHAKSVISGSKSRTHVLKHVKEIDKHIEAVQGKRSIGKETAKGAAGGGAVGGIYGAIIGGLVGGPVGAAIGGAAGAAAVGGAAGREGFKTAKKNKEKHRALLHLRAHAVKKRAKMKGDDDAE